MRKRINEQKGITLVALVVTIIILLILAGVAIATVTEDNGLFRKAREAVNTYKGAEANESQSLDYIAGQLGDLAKYDYNGYAKSTMEMTVSDGTYYLPEGFKLASDSGKTIDEGIVIEDKNGNEWVWVPCYVEGGKGSDVENAIKYNRYIYGDIQSFKNEDYTKIYIREETSWYLYEALADNERLSVKQYGGYYIGRYEAGDKESTAAKEYRKEGSPTTNTVTIKKGQAPYNYVNIAEAERLSNEMASKNNYTNGVVTKLCSSYAWDTALKFIDKKYPNYSETGKVGEEIIGNYRDSQFEFEDLNGDNGTKASGSSKLLPTGTNGSVCNIFDMGGNILDGTSEYTEGSGSYVSYRGGAFDSLINRFYPGHRSAGDSQCNPWKGFRASLFIKASN